jgi:nucleoside-diphosphate-sugar epimerase
MVSFAEQPILVTGAAGCIGAWVVAALVREGTPVVAFDRSDDIRRLRLLLSEEQIERVAWRQGDVTDLDGFERLVAEEEVGGIVHLAALQVPFCKADPVEGARVNVVGSVNVLEVARRREIRNLVYASSIAALPFGGAAHPSTIYGVYKAADEAISEIYWRDYGVPSVGLRPHTVYGVGRDQGLTSAPTNAMLAAAAGRRYTIPFSGGVQFQYAGDVADDLLHCLRQTPEGAPVFDIGGEPVSIEDIVLAIQRVVDGADLAVSGPPLPFPHDRDRGALRAFIGDSKATGLDDGVAATVKAFRELLGRGLVSVETE